MNETKFYLDGAGIVTAQTISFLTELSDSTFDQNVRDKIGKVLNSVRPYSEYKESAIKALLQID